MEVSLSFARFSSMEPGVRHNNIYWRQLNLWPLTLFEISRQSQHSWQGKSFSPLPHVILRQTAERREKRWKKKKQQWKKHKRQETVSRSNKWRGIWSVEPFGSRTNMQDRMWEKVIQELSSFLSVFQCPEQLHLKNPTEWIIPEIFTEVIMNWTRTACMSVLIGHGQLGKT